MRERICKISLFSVILACVSALPTDAAVHTKNSNRSYAGAYQQLNAMYGQQAYSDEQAPTSAVANLPVMIDDEKLAESIVNNEVGAPSVSDLEACSMIYANGNFKWGTPEYGINRTPQCIAIVELRDANSNALLASTTVGAGQSIKCNIDSFPTGSFNMSALSKIELPADNAPTMEDVVAVMNQEQKQNAGLKIAAGAIIAGVAGNLLAKKDASANDTGTISLGTGKTQLLDTAVGAAAGAGIMAASSYTGKVAGDTIKSTAVNAASGMLIGNMMAGINGAGNVIATTKCSVNNIEYDCVVGNYEKYGKIIKSTTDEFYIIKSNKSELRKCEKDTYNKIICTPQTFKVSAIKVVTTDSAKEIDLDKVIAGKIDTVERWVQTDTKTPYAFERDPSQSGREDSYYKIAEAKTVTDTERAYAVFESGKLNKVFGYQDWDELKSKNPKIYHRYAGGGVGDLIDDENAIDNFDSSSREATDGGATIDLSNQARAKSTLVGTAAGGALGGFAGYQGAQSEVSERWVSALREYEDSLSNFVCITGARPLSKYNDYADIPALKTDK